MIESVRPVDSLRVEDLQAFPVWQYTGRDAGDETYVRPVRRTPVTSLTGRVVGTQVVLGNGERVWALIGNVDPNNPRMTEHFLTVSVERCGRWFGLARYHDFDFAERGPDALARFLGLPVDAVFPLTYDISHVVKGRAAAIQGQILKEPRERLSRSEIIAMAVP